MGQTLTFTIDSIDSGMQVFEDAPGANQFTYSKAIDPDFVGEDNVAVRRKAGLITPVPYRDQSSSSVDDAVIAILTGYEIPSGSTREIITVQENGKLFSYSVGSDGSIATETSLGTVTGGNASGANYYDDYVYILGTGASADDVSRYGPLSGSPSLTNGVWTGATLGSQGSLQSQDMPAHNGALYPDHWGHVHVDNALYFADHKNNPSRATLNKIKTIDGTNDGSATTVLDLPIGYSITDIESYGNDLVISASRIAADSPTNPPENNGAAALFFWDTISDSFYKQVDIPEYAYVSALQNKGGTIYVFAGNTEGGHAVGYYDGADAVTQILFLPNGNPPFPGAVGTYGNRLSWGSWDDLETVNDELGMIYSIGSKDARKAASSLHCIATSSIGEAAITAFGYIPYKSGDQPKFIFAGHDGTGGATNTIETYGGADNSAIDSNIQFGAYNIGQPFKVSKIRLNRSAASGDLTADTTITPILRMDDRTVTYTLNPIATSNTNFDASRRSYVYKAPELVDLVSNETAQGEHDFILELAFTGTQVVSLKFPIFIEIETIDD